MMDYGDDRHVGPALPKAMLAKAVALLLGCMLGCSDDSDNGAGTAGAGGASGSESGGGGTGGSLAAGGSGGSSGTSAGATGGAGTGGSGTSGSGGRAGSGATVSLDAGLGGSGATDSTGDIQRCEGSGACLEFRGHDPACQETNAFNCSNVLNGTYSQGECPPDYDFVEVEETFCGPTATFIRPAP